MVCLDVAVKTWDVIVLGLGGVGSAAVCHLANAGCRVLGLDQYAPVHDLGSSHGRTRAIRQAYFEHPAYVPLLMRAYELWGELEDQSQDTLLHRTGLVEIGPADGVVIPGVLRSANEHGLNVERLTSHDVMRRWPGLRAEEDWVGVLENEGGYLEVERAVSTHLRLAQRAGATCRHEEEVLAWCVKDGAVEISTAKETYHAGHLVVAAGAWSQSMLIELEVKLRVLRKHQYWYTPGSTGFQQSEGFPCFFHETPSGYFYGFPANEACGVKVARHSDGTPLHHPSPHVPCQEDQHAVEGYLKDYLPNVGDQLESQCGCYYTMTADEHFLIDRHPLYPQVTVLAGLSGHGFKFTSVLGEIAAQLALHGKTELDTTLFQWRKKLTESGG